jgi:demethylmenaquinone methyltransferase / 2-methoxy-6-polyprenyl-1,4-benzoquinol methylase
MGPTYDIVNMVSSFGFSALWRRECVRNARIVRGDRVCDMMAGSGECWGHLPARCHSLVAIDFCSTMVRGQKNRMSRVPFAVDSRTENAVNTSLANASVDCVISAFGLKTLTPEATSALAREIYRILKPRGRFSILEISTADGWPLAPLYQWYLKLVIPAVGKLCLGDIECYRMLGEYTRAFVSCDRVAAAFSRAGLKPTLRKHFYGCATSLVGTKPA